MARTNPQPQALAVRDGKILATGTLDELRPLAGSHTEWVDLQGKTLLPGFFDAHMHLWKVGDLLTFNLDLRGVASIAEIQDKLLDFCNKNNHLSWIRARGFNEASLKEGRLPTRQDIDKVIRDKPVFLQRTCAHISCVNSKALEICGITAATPVPFGGEIRLAPDGEPSGILCETAQGLAMRHFPPITEADYETMILAGCRELMRHGITAVTDPAVMPDLLEVYKKMDREGRLPMRIHAIPIMLPDGGDEPLPLPELYASDRLVINTVKFFADGGLSGQTAALSRPYKISPPLPLPPSPPPNKGILRLQYAQYLQLTREAQDRGFQVATHAIGDEAIGFVLDVYEQLKRENPGALRHRIEHLGLPNEHHKNQIEDLGVHVVTQPIFLTELGRNFRQYLDDEFLQQCYPVRSLLDRGINVAFSTDAPVVRDLRPLACIAAAISRKDADGIEIAPHEAVTMQEALYCYTAGSALANRVFDKTGSLEPGKNAEMVMLSGAPWECADLLIC
jgi:predicted amidohydrolase YtcJ